MLADRVKMASITGVKGFTVNLIRNNGYIEYSINGGAYVYTSKNETLTNVETIKFRADVPKGGDDSGDGWVWWWWYQLSVREKNDDNTYGPELVDPDSADWIIWETPVIELSRDTTYVYSIDEHSDGVSW